MKLFGKKTFEADDDSRDRWLLRGSRWARFASYGSLLICPLLLLWQLVGWVEVRFWADISIGSLITPDPTTRTFDPGRFRLIKDMLWIPLWSEFLVAGLALFVLHMVLWNMFDVKRQARRRARRSTPGHEHKRRRSSSGGKTS
jgi:hypothetical protein